MWNLQEKDDAKGECVEINTVSFLAALMCLLDVAMWLLTLLFTAAYTVR